MMGRLKWHAAWAMAAALAMARLAQNSGESSTPIVTVRSGALRGAQFGTHPNDVAFLGIPYAASPVGELRWKPPVRVAEWTGTRNSTQFGPACPQPPAGWLPYPHWSEDCLFLNVWTTQVSGPAGEPVLVYFHGGSNRAGYSQLNQLGPSLSPMGLVVVSANYRLGPLGFLAHQALTAESPHASSGNYGLLDQIEALKWVRENIDRFGGDPSRITVMGQSAGAVDICLLMASPLARGLFQRAILQSGDCQSTLNEDIRIPIALNGISGTGEAYGDRFADDLGVAKGTNELQKLREVPVESLLKAWRNDRGLHFDAIVDGWVVPAQPAKIFAEGKQAHIPVLVGSNADEATVFGPGPANLAEYREFLRADTGDYANQEFQIWPAQTDADVRGQYLKLQNMSFAYGAWSMARAMTRIGQPAYLYRFTWAETGGHAQLGAYHGEELAFLDNSFPAGWGSSNQDQEFGQVIRTYWSNFAKTGDANLPTSSNGPARTISIQRWPVFNQRSGQVFALGRDITPIPIDRSLQPLDSMMTRIVSSKSSQPQPQ
jgi:para-nitrobenzyl esterase